jgi:hypothetical protein
VICNDNAAEETASVLRGEKCAAFQEHSLKHWEAEETAQSDWDSMIGNDHFHDQE